MGFLFKAVIYGMCISFGRDAYDWVKEKLSTVDWAKLIQDRKGPEDEVK